LKQPLYNEISFLRGDITIDQIIEVIPDIKCKLSLSSTLFALKEFQKAMEGEAEKAVLRSDEDVADLITEMRNGKNA